ncbi:MAG: response regulator [Acidobacteria bacterium]|nr:response regulator [Acidobacteriota bacterium]
MVPTNVLLVDDDSIIIKLVSTYLRMHGVSVTTAENGQEALEHLKESTPELIIADIDMPVMGGYELYRQVKLLGYEDIPFFFCSSASSLPERLVGLQMGADDYIVKPINPPELLLKIKLNLVKARQFRFLKKLLQDQQIQYLMSGQLGDTDVAGLLQVISFLGHRDFYLQIDNPDYGVGEIYLSNGVIIHASLSNLIGKKALFRLLEWKIGTFRVEKKTFPHPATVNERLEECLLDTVAKLDEYNCLIKSITERGHTLFIKDPILLSKLSRDNYQIITDKEPTSSLKIKQSLTKLDKTNQTPTKSSSDKSSQFIFTAEPIDNTNLVLELVNQYRKLSEVLDQSSLTDLETLEIIDKLLAEDVIGIF